MPGQAHLPLGLLLVHAWSTLGLRTIIHIQHNDFESLGQKGPGCGFAVENSPQVALWPACFRVLHSTHCRRHALFMLTVVVVRATMMATAVVGLMLAKTVD